MKKLLFALMLIPQMAAAQFSQKEGWNIHAEVNTASEESYRMHVKDMERDYNVDIQEKVKARLLVGKTHQMSDYLTVGFSANYDYYNFSIGQQDASLTNGNQHHNFGLSGNAIYKMELWEKPFIVAGNLKLEASQWGLERFSGMGTGMLMLKSSSEEQLGVGVLLLVNHTTKIPVFPIAMWRKVLDDRWTVNLNYPFYSMQYTVDTQKRHTVMGGFTFDADHFWMKVSEGTDKRVLLFRRSLLKTGINYEYKITPDVVMNAQAGWEYTMRAAIYSRHGGTEKMTFNHPSGIYAMMNLKVHLK